MRQTFGEAVYSMLHLLPKNEQKQAHDKFVYAGFNPENTV
jgi:hypothetical protein